MLLEPSAGSAGAARDVLRDALREAGRERWRDAAEVALSEAATNVVLHAHTSFEVRIEVASDEVRVEVRDFSSMIPVQRGSDEQATTGRGMALIAALTAECGVRVLPEGKVVWFAVRDEPDEEELDEDALLAAWDFDDDGDGLEQPVVTPQDEETREVVLERMPPTLWLAARQHHDTMLRELVLYLAEHRDETADLTLADGARGRVTRAVLEAIERVDRDEAAGVLPPGHPSPLPWTPVSLDLRVRVPPSAAAAYAALQDALDTAERLAVAGRLLARPGLPEIVAVRDWVCEQVIAQLAGVAPSPWPGTAQERFTDEFHDRALPVPSGWDVSVVRDADRGVVAADDANRIVAISRPLASALGWSPDELVGRRVVALIPPALREAHVAGFSRHLSSGEANVLGVPLELPVLHRDGSSLPCRFLVEQAPSNAGRSVYLAWIDPL